MRRWRRSAWPRLQTLELRWRCAGKKKRFKKPSMRAGRAVDSDEAANALSLLEDVDMSCLHRSLHVQEMLGDMEVRPSIAPRAAP